MKRYLSAQEAAKLLRISTATLYSYVSRGLITSEETGSDKRAKQYLREDVERLLKRKELRKNPVRAAEEALDWGAPILESSITLIENGKLYYRGVNVEALAREATLEEVLSLVWEIDVLPDMVTNPIPESFLTLQPHLTNLTTLERFQILLPLLGSNDYSAYNTTRSSLVETGYHILHMLVAVAADDNSVKNGIAETLHHSWSPNVPQSEQLLSASLILCADHELNVSSFTARCVASAGTTLYAIINAGLCALQGINHGGYTSRVDALFREVEVVGDARTTITGRVKRGEAIPGFDHKLYPDGDPRARVLLDMLYELLPYTTTTGTVRELEHSLVELTGMQPTIDLALVSLEHALELPKGSALTLFALGRTIGWIGHAMEQYETGKMIRPRARYIGKYPGE